MKLKVGKTVCAFDHKYSESRMSECQHGCKIYRCSACGHEQVIHNPAYGCKEGK